MVFCCVCIALHGIFFTSMVFQGIFMFFSRYFMVLRGFSLLVVSPIVNNVFYSETISPDVSLNIVCD